MFLQTLKSGIAVITILIIALAPAHSEDVTPADQSATQSVIADQISAFQSSDFERAYSHAAPSIQQVFPTIDRFIAMVKGGYNPLFNPDYYSFGRNTLLYGEVYQEVIVTDQNGKQWQAVYTLKQQPDGSWKITGVKLEPHKGAST